MYVNKNRLRAFLEETHCVIKPELQVTEDNKLIFPQLVLDLLLLQHCVSDTTCFLIEDDDDEGG